MARKIIYRLMPRCGINIMDRLVRRFSSTVYKRIVEKYWYYCIIVVLPIKVMTISFFVKYLVIFTKFQFVFIWFTFYRIITSAEFTGLFLKKEPIWRMISLPLTVQTFSSHSYFNIMKYSARSKVQLTLWHLLHIA